MKSDSAESSLIIDFMSQIALAYKNIKFRLINNGRILFSTIGDMFPKSTIATITGIGTMAGGIASFLINKGAGMLFDYAAESNMTFLGFVGKPAGYFIIFCICAVAYIIAWSIMKTLVPKHKPIVLD